MRLGSLSLLLLTLLAAVPPDTYTTLQQQAEASYAEKSFSRAHELYLQVSRLQLPPAERRWVVMRLADTTWRMDAANPGADNAKRDEARKALEDLIRDTGDDHDRAWAEANESLGDFYLTHPQQQNIGLAFPWYEAALDWWAGNDDLALARKRYLDIVFRVTTTNEGAQSDVLPREVLLNAVSIAVSPEDRAHTRYLLARHFLVEYRPQSIERGLELLDQIIREGKTNPWYDDALFAAAQRLAQGAVVVLDNGETSFKPDFTKALELYRRLVSEFRKGETPYFSQATSAIEAIIGPSVTAMADGTFLPSSEQEIVLSWRNVKSVELAITAVDLMNDAHLTNSNVVAWVNSIDPTGRSPIRQWTFTTNDRGDHAPGNDRIRLTPKLPPGAYIVQASAGGKSARQIVLVTDASIVVHQAGGRSDILVCDAVTGQPIPGARIRVLQQREQNDAYVSRDANTDANGLATVAFDVPVGGSSLIFTSAPNGRQAWLASYQYSGRSSEAEWRIYAFTDRPAYRPDETVHWKFIARVRQDDRWVTPAKATLEYEITSPRGEKQASGTATLNEFGSFWSDLPLTSAMPLGVYTIQFHKNDSQQGPEIVGYAQLFRLEEYKLPEFRVEVKTPEGRKYRLGETVEATIDATYYFGGPVANASVEAVIFSRPLVHYWSGWREYPWYYQNPDYGYGQELKRETLRTDASGRAVIRFETVQDDVDKFYRIEARVTDSSRREVAGSGTVQVMKQRYSVIAHPTHFLLRPGEKAAVDFKAIDANEQPVQTTGTVKVIRHAWHEPVMPVSSHSRRRGAYQEEEILSTTVTTDAKGEATFAFNAPREGYYLIRWTSEDRDPGRPLRARDLVKAETTIWVSDRATTDLGYHAGGLEIIVDKETFRAGQTASAMIATPASGRWVLLTTSAGGILDTQVLRLDGTVKLVQIPLDDRHTPSFFLTASSVFDRMLANVMQTIVVPPVEHFINVEIKPDRQQYEPRQEGSVTVTTRDVDGKPVAAEVALSVSDESVSAIQSDLAGDPRQFFFGQLRPYMVQAGASVQTQRYIVLVEEDGKLIDERQRDLEKRRKDEEELDREQKEEGVVGSVVGGAVGGVRGAAPPAAMARNAAVSEAITVTAQALFAPAPPPQKPGIEVQVRSDFRSTAFWKADVLTGGDGVARVTVKFPEALTTWRATGRAVTALTQVGMGSETVRTTMPLIVRLQAPRFFVAGDRATISAVMNNNTNAAMHVAPSIDVEGVTLQGSASAAAIDVPPHGEARADWIVVAEHAGTAKLRVTGRAADRGDAMEKTFTVYEHGVDKLVARSGKLRGEEAIVKLDLPHARRATALTVQIQPSLAVTMLDALPFLIDYPYGCTEQTMSRFLPAAIVARTLASNGLNARDIEGRMFGGIEKKAKGKDLHLLGAMTGASMARLYDFQHGDGGWGWWKEGDSDDFMTAYVVWGFSVAKEGGLKVDDNAVRRGIAWLDRRLIQSEERWQEQTWMLHAIAAWRAAAHDGSMSVDEKRAFDNVWSHRQRLVAYSRALLALTADDFGDAQRAAVLVRNLEDGVKIDRAPDRSVLVRGSEAAADETMATAHWGEDRFWWRWHEGPVESTAFALQALVRIDPKNKLIEPAMNWLVKNRRGAQWNNTRDTAIAIFALNDYLRASGELNSGGSYELSVNGRVIASRQVTAASILGAPARFQIEDALVRDANEIRIRHTGGPIYFAVEGRFVSLEEPVTAAGNELFVRREYFRLAPHPTLLKGVSYERVPLLDNGTVNSGERVEVVVTIETKNDYDYLMFEDLKPAGLEAVSLQSGQPLFAREVRTPRTAWVYQELRDRKVALFIDHLPQGVWEIRYTLRAEVPGAFHALPLLGQAMYVPEIRANGDEVRVTVRPSSS